MKKTKPEFVDELLLHLDSKSSDIRDPRSNVTVSCRMYGEWNDILEAIAGHYNMKKSSVVRTTLIHFIVEAGEKLGISRQGRLLGEDERKQLSLPGVN